MNCMRILAYITGKIEQELLSRNEYLVAENRILRAQLNGRLRLTDAERRTLAKIAHRLGRKVLQEIATVAKPDTILRWYRQLVAKKFDGSPYRKRHGRPRVGEEVEALVIKMATENCGWGYDRIAGALFNLGYELSDQTVGNILKRHDIPPASKRGHTTTWADFIKTHMAVLAATDFFTVEVLTLRGLITYYVLFFMLVESRRVEITGITRHPNERWMKQIARNVTLDEQGLLTPCRYLLHDRDSKYTKSFQRIIATGGVTPVALPARSPNLNAYAERWVKSVKDDCLSKMIIFSETSLRFVLREYCAHYHGERNHQGKGNVLLFPARDASKSGSRDPIRTQERVGGLLKYYHREAA